MKSSIYIIIKSAAFMNNFRDIFNCIEFKVSKLLLLYIFARINLNILRETHASKTQENTTRRLFGHLAILVFITLWKYEYASTRF